MDRRKSNTENMRLSNYVAANKQVKAGRARLVKGLPRAYAASHNENHVYCDTGNIRTTEVTTLLYSANVKQHSHKSAVQGLDSRLVHIDYVYHCKYCIIEFGI